MPDYLANVPIGAITKTMGRVTILAKHGKDTQGKSNNNVCNRCF